MPSPTSSRTSRAGPSERELRASLASAEPKGVSLSLFLWSAVLLSLERLCYVWIWRTPERFRAICEDLAQTRTTPITVLRFLFSGF